MSDTPNPPVPATYIPACNFEQTGWGQLSGEELGQISKLRVYRNLYVYCTAFIFRSPDPCTDTDNKTSSGAIEGVGEWGNRARGGLYIITEGWEGSDAIPW